jgi:transposase-like protein
MAEQGKPLSWEYRQRIIKLAKEHSIRGTARQADVSRNTVRKVLRKDSGR